MLQRPFRAILWSRLDARCGNISVLRLELHRHLHETTSLGRHTHPHWQALVYLSGHGIQEVGNTIHHIVSGSLVLLPPKIRHAFRREARQAPLCLILDFQAPWERRSAVRALATFEIARIRSTLAEMARMNDENRVPDQIGRAALALRLMALIAEASGWYPKPLRKSALTVLYQVQRLLEKNPLASPKSIAGALDYHPDHLSRLVRAETGLNLRALAAQTRLRHVRRLLREYRLVRDVAEAAGFADQNYFARWFKKQTGKSPAVWRKERVD